MKAEDISLEIRHVINYLDDDLRTFNKHPKFRKELMKDIKADVARINELCSKLELEEG